MDSGLIFAIVVALWLACLIPDWISRREHLSSSRARDRFSGAMRVLARRRDVADVSRAAPGPVYVLGPPLGKVAALGAPPAPKEPEAVPSPVRTPADAATTSGPRVRRRARRFRVRPVLFAAVLVLALLATPALAVAAALRALPPAAPLTSLAVAVGTLAILRWTAVLRLRADARRRRAVAAAPAQRRPVEAVVVAPSPLDPTERGDDASRRASSGRTSRDGTWTPVPVPPPTYLLKAAAPPRPAPPRPASAPRPAAAEPPPAPMLPDLDDVLERRRAAGE